MFNVRLLYSSLLTSEEGLLSHFPEEELRIVELQREYAFPSLIFRSEPRNGDCL